MHFHKFFSIVSLAALSACASKPDPLPQGPQGKAVKMVSSLVQVDLGNGTRGIVERRDVDLDDFNHSFNKSIRGLDSPPKIIAVSPPAYPAALKKEGVEGFARLEFVVDEKGAVVYTKVIKASRSEFGFAAVRSVLTWRYEPMKRNGVPTKMKFSEVFNFRL